MKDNLIALCINNTYTEGIKGNDLYEITRQAWTAKLEEVKNIDYALAVYNTNILEVYKIDNWEKSKYDSNRIVFNGKVADEDIRKKYIGKTLQFINSHSYVIFNENYFNQRM